MAHAKALMALGRVVSLAASLAIVLPLWQLQTRDFEARRLAAVKVNTCETSQLGGLPFPGLDAVTSALPSPDVVRPRLVVMERFMRAVPFWQPLREKEILPTAESDLEDEMMGKRWRDAVVGALLLIGVAVAMAQFFAAVGNCVAERTASKKPVASSSNASVLIVNEGPSETRPMLKAPEEESAGILAGFYEYELSLGLGKSAMLLVYYVLHNGFLLVLMSWSMTNNLMLGSAGLVWEAMGLWLVAVLAVDVLGYLGRAIQAAWIGRKVPSPWMPMIMSIVPILGPRVDLLKDCMFTASVLQLAACAEDDRTQQRGFWIGVCSLVTLFTPGPFLFCDGASRMEVAKEFLPALGVRLQAFHRHSTGIEDLRSRAIDEGWSPLVVDVLLEAVAELIKVLSQQTTPARLWIAIGEDVPQAVLAVMAMLNFQQFSGLLLLNLVFCCVKIAGILAIRWLLLNSGAYVLDPSAIAIMAASHGLEVRTEEGGTPLMAAAALGDTEILVTLLNRGADKDATDEDGWTPLRQAVEQGRAECMELLLKAGAEKDATDNAGRTPLHVAAEQGRAECMELLLKAGAEKEATDKDGLTPLHDAARKGHAECVDLLLKAGAKKDATDEDGKTPLHIAAAECVDLLLKNGAEKDAASKSGKTPLHLATEQGRAECVDLLLKAGADKDATDEDGETPLHVAARMGRIKSVDLLLKAGAEKDATNEGGRTPLQVAARMGHAECVDLLLNAGAEKASQDLEFGSEEGGTPLMAAAVLGDTESLATLLNRGADKDAANEGGRTPLHVAARMGHAECVDLLLKAGAEKGATDNAGKTPLHFAAPRDGKADCVDLLLKAGAEKDATDKDGRTPLYWAAVLGHAECVGLLLKAGAEKDSQNKDGATPLHQAAFQGHAECVDFLLKAGAKKEATDKDGVTPLHDAARSGRAECVDLLLKAGAEKEATDKDGRTPLYWAAVLGHAECVDLLLKAGAEKDVQLKEYGWTPLHEAALKGHSECVDFLLKAGAKKEATDKDGDTPLHLAALKGHAECVDFLLKAGAEKEATDKDGDTPLHLAALKGHAECVDFLLKAGAEKDSQNKDGKTALDVAEGEACKSLLEKASSFAGP